MQWFVKRNQKLTLPYRSNAENSAVSSFEKMVEYWRNLPNGAHPSVPRKWSNKKGELMYIGPSTSMPNYIEIHSVILSWKEDNNSLHSLHTMLSTVNVDPLVGPVLPLNLHAYQMAKVYWFSILVKITPLGSRPSDRVMDRGMKWRNASIIIRNWSFIPN